MLGGGRRRRTYFPRKSTYEDLKEVHGAAGAMHIWGMLDTDVSPACRGFGDGKRWLVAACPTRSTAGNP